MSNDLTKGEVSAVAQKAGCAWLHEPLAQRFATLCRAPLVAENAALKQAHEINADTLNAMQVEIDDWKARALKAEQAGDRAVPDAEDYDLIDRYLRNNLDDADYGEYLAALDRLVTPQPAAQEPVAFPMESAPRDSTLVRLLVNFEANSLEDSPDPVWTIGANCFDNDGIDEWKFAGWDWSQDCFAEGAGKPIGWLPMLSAIPPLRREGCARSITTGADMSDPVVGHKTFRDGISFRHEPLRQSEADALMKRIDEADKRRAELMPTEQDAVRMMFQAWRRLKELGWRETMYGPTNETVQLIESGSSGIHKGQRWNEWPEKTWWIDGDSPSNPCLFKPMEQQP